MTQLLLCLPAASVADNDRLQCCCTQQVHAISNEMNNANDFMLAAVANLLSRRAMPVETLALSHQLTHSRIS